MRRATRALVFLACVAVLHAPAPALAQAVAGTVADADGAILPRVIVEARGPALIETVRTAETNDRGQYLIDGLRPGLYSVIFRLDGFGPYVREGVELTGSLTATVDAVLTVGSLTDTVTVAGAVPVVDVRSPNREWTLSGDLIKAIPTVRSYNALVVLVPGVVTSVNDMVTGTATTAFPIHGGRTNEARLAVDGLVIGSPPSGNSATSYAVDAGLAHEVSFLNAGALGEVETAGLVMNIIPKTGGDAVRGSFFGSGTSAQFQSDNLTDQLRGRGLMSATPLSKVYDLSGALGGPMLKGRVWYFANAHVGGTTKEIANVYYNRNAGNPTAWLYAPDFTRRAFSDRTFENASGRVTWMMTPRNKVGAFIDAQRVCRTCTGATAGLQEPVRVSPEAVGVLGRPLYVSQATWSASITSRLLIDARYGGTYFGVGNFERQPNPTRDLIRVAEQCASGCSANGNIPGLVYRSQDFSRAYAGSYLWQGTVSYVSVEHSMKVGYQQTFMTDDRTWMTNTQNLTYRFDNGVPNQLTQSISPWVNDARAAWNAVFAQHRWTMHRVTVQSAVRFDRARSWFLEQREGPSRFLPAPLTVPRAAGVNAYTDITPRMGVAYDLLGTGRSALKLSFGRFLEGVGVTGNYANTNPTLRMPRTTPAFGTPGVTRAWNDANGNFAPDCDLMNPAAQDLRAGGGDRCGAMSDVNFGRDVLTNNFDARMLSGWGVRPSDWSLDVSAQHQMFERASVGIAYTRRWFDGFFVADNVLVQPSDLTRFSVLAPVDLRLPGGGGYVVSGLYDVVPEKFGQVSNLVGDADDHGSWRQYFNGIDVTANVRNGRLSFAGGISSGQTVTDNCEVRSRLPELDTTTTGTSTFGAGLMSSAVTPLSPYCHVATGMLTQIRALASYLFPKDINLSATFQSKPGSMLAANWAVPGAVAAASLERDLSGNVPNVTVNLVPPGTRYGDRINQLDLRLAKILRYGRTRTMLAMDVYNALNSSAALAYNAAFVPAAPWPRPMMLLTPRFVKITGEIEF